MVLKDVTPAQATIPFEKLPTELQHQIWHIAAQDWISTATTVASPFIRCVIYHVTGHSQNNRLSPVKMLMRKLQGLFWACHKSRMVVQDVVRGMLLVGLELFDGGTGRKYWDGELWAISNSYKDEERWRRLLRDFRGRKQVIQSDLAAVGEH